MNDLKSLESLRPVAGEMLGGLHADERMRLSIKRAAAEPKRERRKQMRLVPAACCAALALVCAGVVTTRLSDRPIQPDAGVMMARSMPDAVVIDTIAAGEEAALPEGEMIAALGENAKVRTRSGGGESLLAQAGGDKAIVAVNGAVYQMLETPKDVAGGMLAGEIGSIARFDEQPSLASPAEMKTGLSNVAGEGEAVYAISGLSERTAVAAKVNGSMRVFQRVSYAGRGPTGHSFEDTFCVRGQVKRIELSGVGELSGDAAERVIAVLLDNAVLKSTDATARGQTLTVTLHSGLKLQLGVSGDTLCGCGGWSCPEFFEAFEAAM